ncbi:MAG: RNA-binding protein [Pseudomonadota bacterium]
MNPRTCIATRTEKSPDEMIRFVLDPEKRVVPDLKRNLPGRGVWVTAGRRELKQVIDKQLFSRGFKEKVKVDPSLVELVEERMKANITALLSMARKAGVMLTGKAKVENQIRKQKISLLVQAADADGDGKRKLKSLIKTLSPQTALFEILTSDELDTITGSVNTVHAGLETSGITEQIKTAILKFERFNHQH